MSLLSISQDRSYLLGFAIHLIFQILTNHSMFLLTLTVTL